MGIEVAHPGTPVSTDGTAEWFLPCVHPDVHGELLLGDEPLVALLADMLPAVIAPVSFLTEVQPTPETGRSC